MSESQEADSGQAGRDDRVSVPKQLIVDHLIFLWDEWGDTTDWTRPPTRDAEQTLEWNVDDVDNWEVNIGGDEDTIVLTGRCEGKWSEKTARRTRHHPAEWETHTEDVRLTITAQFEYGRSDITLEAEVA